MCWGFGGDGDHVLEEEGEARKGGGVHWCNGCRRRGEYGCFQSVHVCIACIFSACHGAAPLCVCVYHVCVCVFVYISK